jgi:hypothetical protein
MRRRIKTARIFNSIETWQSGTLRMSNLYGKKPWLSLKSRANPDKYKKQIHRMETITGGSYFGWLKVLSMGTAGIGVCCACPSESVFIKENSKRAISARSLTSLRRFLLIIFDVCPQLAEVIIMHAQVRFKPAARLLSAWSHHGC